MKKPKKQETEEEDVIVTALKNKYWELIKKERIPGTPEITKNLDKIEKQIKELQKQQKNIDSK